jgi:peptidoglycan hydrolase-like protein with peptidoglycan-binding domain
VIYDLERACQASLERSRERRATVAARLAQLRRTRLRRGRRGGVSVLALSAALALGAPLALAQSSAQAPAPSTLKSGASGSAVSALQAALGVKQTGTFTAATARAVRSFQRKHGLTVDGIVGPQTAAALGLPSGTSSSSKTASAAGAAAGGDAASALAKIAACESGGDPTAVSADGVYRGKYQFTRSTWAQMGGSGDPAAAPESEQDARAATLYAQQGTAPWPVCGKGVASSSGASSTATTPAASTDAPASSPATASGGTAASG